MRRIATGQPTIWARATLAASVLLRNVYGWFERTEHDVYRLNNLGQAALLRWPTIRSVISQLMDPNLLFLGMRRATGLGGKGIAFRWKL